MEGERKGGGVMIPGGADDFVSVLIMTIEDTRRKKWEPRFYIMIYTYGRHV